MGIVLKLVFFYIFINYGIIYYVGFRMLGKND